LVVTSDTQIRLLKNRKISNQTLEKTLQKLFYDGEASF